MSSRETSETLISAVKRHDVELVKKALLQQNADVNYQPQKVTTPWGMFLGSQSHEDKRDWSPLMEAVTNNYVDLVELLFNMKADVNLEDSKGNTALHLACAYGRDQITTLLFEKEANTVAQNHRGQTPLHLAAAHSLPCTKLLLLSGVDPKTQCHEGLSPLHEACKENNVDILWMLLLAGGDIEQRDKNGATPVFYAASFGATRCYDMLVEQGADVNVPTYDGQTCLHARFFFFFVFVSFEK